MKVALAVAVALVAACGGAPTPAPAPAPAPIANTVPDPEEPAPAPVARSTIDVAADGTVRIAGVALPPEPRSGDVLPVLGAASRVEDLANEIHVYDELGLAVYRQPATDKIIEILVFFAESDDYDFDPATPYTGRLTIAGTAIDGTTPADAVPGVVEYGDKIASYGPTTVFFTYGAWPERLTTVAIDFPH